jgi:hypothetical protein
MPIVNTREGNPRWGYLQGLGAAAAEPRLLLRDPKTGAFSNARFEELKGILISAKTQAEKDFQALEKKSRTGIFSALTTKEAAAKIRKDMVDIALPRLNRFRASLEKFYNPNYSGWDSEQEYNGVLKGYQGEMRAYAGDAETLDVAWNLSFYNALVDRAREVLKDVYDAGAGVIGPGIWFMKNLPWILGVGAFLLVFGPTIGGALTGGRRGAAEAATADIMRARGAIADGARRATGLRGSPKRRTRR